MVYRFIKKDKGDFFSNPDILLFPEYNITVRDIMALRESKRESDWNNYVHNIITINVDYTKISISTTCCNEYGGKYSNNDWAAFGELDIHKVFPYDFQKKKGFEDLMHSTIKTIVL